MELFKIQLKIHPNIIEIFATSWEKTFVKLVKLDPPCQLKSSFLSLFITDSSAFNGGAGTGGGGGISGGGSTSGWGTSGWGTPEDGISLASG